MNRSPSALQDSYLFIWTNRYDNDVCDSSGCLKIVNVTWVYYVKYPTEQNNCLTAVLLAKFIKLRQLKYHRVIIAKDPSWSLGELSLCLVGLTRLISNYKFNMSGILSPKLTT